MKKSEAVKKLNDWFKRVEAKQLPPWANTPGDWLLWYLETHLEMLPPTHISTRFYDAFGIDNAGSYEQESNDWEPENE